MDERATGVILRTQPLTETSLIVNWLTREAGRVQTVAKGARRPKSPFHGRLDLFFVADFSFQRSRRSDLHTLREIQLRGFHGGLRTDIERLHQAAYCTRLIELATEPEATIPVIHDLFLGVLSTLETGGAANANSVLAFEGKLLRELGLDPVAVGNRLNAGVREILRVLIDFDWTELTNIRITNSQAVELSRVLESILAQHLGRVPAGRVTALLRSN